MRIQFFCCKLPSIGCACRRHLEQPDLARFLDMLEDVHMQTSPPMVYWVAPALQYHPTTGSLLRDLHPQMEVIRMELADGWRRGLCVIRRQ
jgi:hypothetical protein